MGNREIAIQATQSVGSGVSHAMALGRHLSREQEHRSRPEPELSTLLAQMAFAAKVIAREVRRAALVGRLGLVGERNPTGDPQKKLDVFANQVVLDAFAESRLVAAIASEELDELRQITCSDRARYLLGIDPLDGSSNTDINGAMGTIFGFFRRSVVGPCHDLEQELREGAELAAAGYVMYGPSTVLVYTSGEGVHGFTFDQDVGEFLLSHEDIRCPGRGPYFSANLARFRQWDPNIRGFVDSLMTEELHAGRPHSLRYVGALVADVHRSLVEGGIYFYPPDKTHERGKLRLLYECAPLAFVVEQAGGSASTGQERILDLRVESLHQTTPLVIGSAEDVAEYERFAAGGKE